MYDICLTVSAWCIIGLLGVLFISSARREISRRALLCSEERYFSCLTLRHPPAHQVKNDKLVSICDADGIKKPETNVQRSVPGRRKH